MVISCRVDGFVSDTPIRCIRKIEGARPGGALGMDGHIFLAGLLSVAQVQLSHDRLLMAPCCREIKDKQLLGLKSRPHAHQQHLGPATTNGSPKNAASTVGTAA